MVSAELWRTSNVIPSQTPCLLNESCRGNNRKKRSIYVSLARITNRQLSVMLFDNPLWAQITKTKRCRDALLHEVTYGWLVLTMQHAFVLRDDDFDDWPRRFWQPVGPVFSLTPFLRSIVDECSMAAQLRWSLFYKLGLDITISWFCGPIDIQFISVTAEFTFCSYCFLWALVFLNLKNVSWATPLKG